MSAKPILLDPIVDAPGSRSTSPAYRETASRWTTGLCMFATDLLALSLVFALAVVVRHILSPAYSLTALLDLAPALVLIISGFWLQGLFPGILMHPAEELRRIVFSVTIAFLLTSSSAFLWRNLDIYSRSVFFLIWATSAPTVLFSRYLTRKILKSFSWWGVSAVLLGSGAAAERVARALKDGRWGIRIMGVLTDNHESTWPDDLPPVIGSIHSAQTPKGLSCEYAILAMPQKPSQDIRSVIQSCCAGFRHVLLVPDMPGIFSLGIMARQMGSQIAFEVPQRLFHRGPAIVKRSLDFLLALAAILALLPVFIVLALCVTTSSRGAIFYGQRRYGRNGSTFKALKFRTMVPDAEQILAEYLALHPEHLFEWQRDHKLKDDPRVTPVGKWMRRLSLDELPQLFNVLAGQMSLVGPRPIVKAEIEKYGDCYNLYSRVRPGITGLWQVSGRNNTTYSERVALDQYYVNNWSVWMDAYILARTIRTVVSAEGAY